MTFLKWALFGLSLLIGNLLIAQPNIPPPPIDPDIPITGGLGYLLAAGIGYGVYALKKRKKS